VHKILLKPEGIKAKAPLITTISGAIIRDQGHEVVYIKSMRCKKGRLSKSDPASHRVGRRAGGRHWRQGKFFGEKGLGGRGVRSVPCNSSELNSRAVKDIEPGTRSQHVSHERSEGRKINTTRKDKPQL